jgi:hypothetical protein
LSIATNSPGLVIEPPSNTMRKPARMRRPFTSYTPSATCVRVDNDTSTCATEANGFG